jgi:hypothetical protein
MSAYLLSETDRAALRNIRSDEFMAPAELISGPCALPDAPLSMPRQQLERERPVAARLLSALRLQIRRLPVGSAERGV